MKISQREAHRLRRRVIELEDIIRRQKLRWSRDFAPGWVNIESLSVTPVEFGKIHVARTLGHAVIAIPDRDNNVLLYADKL